MSNGISGGVVTLLQKVLSWQNLHLWNAPMMEKSGGHKQKPQEKLFNSANAFSTFMTFPRFAFGIGTLASISIATSENERLKITDDKEKL